MRSAVFVVALVGAACAQSHAQSSRGLSSADEHGMSRLPEGAGKGLVQTYCAGACHEVQRIDESQGTHAEWVIRIRRMIRRGAVIPPEKIDPIATYLSAALPPRVRAQTTQASPITVTLGEAAVRPIQIWVRAVAVVSADSQTLRVELPATEVGHVKTGQRVRAFAMSSRSAMLQARVTRVVSEGNSHQAEIRLAIPNPPDRYLVEIITEGAPTFSIPTEAIIEEGDRQLVYVQAKSGDFEPRVIQTGTQGEQYTEVVTGLDAADRVVTFGSFFIDAEYKLKAGQ